MTRKAQRSLDERLSGVPTPKVPDGLAARIAAEVTRLPQVSAEGEAGSGRVSASGGHTGWRRWNIAAGLVGILAAGAITAYSLGLGQAPSQPGNLARGPEAAVIPSVEADEERGMMLAARDSADAGTTPAVPDRTQLAKAAPILRETIEPGETEITSREAVVEEPETPPVAPQAEPMLAEMKAAPQGPALEGGQNGSAAIYGPTAAEGMGVTGGMLPGAGPRAGGPRGGNVGPAPLPH